VIRSDPVALDEMAAQNRGVDAHVDIVDSFLESHLEALCESDVVGNCVGRHADASPYLSDELARLRAKYRADTCGSGGVAGSVMCNPGGMQGRFQRSLRQYQRQGEQDDHDPKSPWCELRPDREQEDRKHDPGGDADGATSGPHAALSVSTSTPASLGCARRTLRPLNGRVARECRARDAVAASNTRFFTTYSPSTLRSRGLPSTKATSGLSSSTRKVPERCSAIALRKIGILRPIRMPAPSTTSRAPTSGINRSGSTDGMSAAINAAGNVGSPASLSPPNQTNVMPNEDRSSSGTAAGSKPSRRSASVRQRFAFFSCQLRASISRSPRSCPSCSGAASTRTRKFRAPRIGGGRSLRTSRRCGNHLPPHRDRSHRRPISR